MLYAYGRLRRPGGLLGEKIHLPGYFFRLSRASGPSICRTLFGSEETVHCTADIYSIRQEDHKLCHGLAFHYELTANPNADYNIYALVLHERVAEISQQDGKLLLRA